MKQWEFLKQLTLPETNSSPLKIGLPNRKGSYSNHPFFWGENVSFGEGSIYLNL